MSVYYIMYMYNITFLYYYKFITSKYILNIILNCGRSRFLSEKLNSHRILLFNLTRTRFYLYVRISLKKNLSEKYNVFFTEKYKVNKQPISTYISYMLSEIDLMIIK